MARSLLVCLVDDSDDFRLICNAIVNRYLPAISLHLFDSGQALLEGLAHLAAKPNLILLDQHMPGLTGYQTLIELKSQEGFKRIPVVMMSADVSHSELSWAYKAGARAFIHKPTDFDQLRQELLNACVYAIPLPDNA